MFGRTETLATLLRFTSEIVISYLPITPVIPVLKVVVTEPSWLLAFSTVVSGLINVTRLTVLSSLISPSFRYSLASASRYFIWFFLKVKEYDFPDCVSLAVPSTPYSLYVGL